MKKIISIFSLISLSLIAIPALAATTNFEDLINNVFIAGIIKPLVPFLIGLAVVVFIYGVLILMFSEGGEKKEEGKQYMLWGIIGIFVMVSVWGLVAILTSSFDLENTTKNINIQVPTVS